MKTWFRTPALAATLVLGALACQDGITSAGDDDLRTLRADVALVAADAMFADLSLMLDPSVLATMGLEPEGDGIQLGSTQSFTRQVTFYDASGAVQPSYHPLTTASIKVVRDLSRSADTTFWSASIERHQEMILSGLEGRETQHTWNGSGTGTVARSRHPEGKAVRTYDMTEESVVADVVRGVPRKDHPYPLSGTITRQIKVTLARDGETVKEWEVTAVITFDGTQFATVTVGPDSWKADLAAGGLKDIFKKKNG